MYHPDGVNFPFNLKFINQPFKQLHFDCKAENCTQKTLFHRWCPTVIMRLEPWTIYRSSLWIYLQASEFTSEFLWSIFGGSFATWLLQMNLQRCSSTEKCFCEFKGPKHIYFTGDGRVSKHIHILNFSFINLKVISVWSVVKFSSVHSRSSPWKRYF